MSRTESVLKIKNKNYSQAEVNKVFGHIPNRTLRQWVITDLHQYHTERGDARGIQRTYEEMHLFQIGLVEVLARANYPFDRIKIISKHLFFGGKYGKKALVENFWDCFLVIGESLDGRGKKIFSGICQDRDAIINYVAIQMPDFISKTIIDLRLIKNRVYELIEKSMM